MKHQHSRSSFFVNCCRHAFWSLTCAALTCASPLRAGETKETKDKVIEQPAPGLKIHGLININISDHYFTPRGLNVENQGVIVQPLALLFWDLYDSNGVLNNVTLTTGVWNSVHSRQSGVKPDNWNEIDPIIGISGKFAKDFQVDVTYTIFRSQTQSFATSQNLEVKLTYDDTKWLGPFALHPYFGGWIELFNKATFAATPESYYLEFGIDPSYTFKTIPLKIELPSYITFPEKDFYGRSSVVGIIGTGVKLSTPLTYIPKSFGNWSVYGAYTHYFMENPALIRDGSFATKPINGDNPFRYTDHNEGVISGGLTCVF